MSRTWHSKAPPPVMTLRGLDWVRAVLRGVVLGVVVFGGLALLLLVRVVERPVWKEARPITPYITQAVCRIALWLLRIQLRVHGRPAGDGGAVAANHSSWLDIFVLNAVDRVYFVSKAEVRSWPGIGWLARATGTVFITRERRAAKAQTDLFAERLRLGHRLLFFPEGTSTDGQRVLHFKSTLFESFLTEELSDTAWVEPVSVVYQAPAGRDPRWYSWWGDMAFGPHLLGLLGTAGRGAVDVVFHPPIPVKSAGSRKALALETEAAVLSGYAEMVNTHKRDPEDAA